MAVSNSDEKGESFKSLKELIEESKQDAVRCITNEILKNSESMNQNKNLYEKQNSAMQKKIDSIIKKVILTRSKLFYNNQSLDLINRSFWQNLNFASVYESPLKELIENKQLKTASKFYERALAQLDKDTSKIEGPFINIIRNDILFEKMAQKQIFYHLINSSDSLDEFNKRIDKIAPKERLSLDDVISNANYANFIWPERSFFNLMYDGRFVPHFKSNISMLNLKYRDKDNDERFALEKIIPYFEQYLIEAKNFNKEESEKFVEFSRYIFLENRDKHTEIKNKINNVQKKIKLRILEAEKRYKEKKIESQRIKIAKDREQEKLERYLKRLYAVNQNASFFLNQIEKSYKAYLIMLNLNYDKFNDDGIDVNTLKNIFKEYDHTFKRYNLLNIGNEIIKTGMLENDKYDDPIVMASEMVTQFLHKIEEKIDNFTYEVSMNNDSNRRIMTPNHIIYRRK